MIRLLSLWISLSFPRWWCRRMHFCSLASYFDDYYDDDDYECHQDQTRDDDTGNLTAGKPPSAFISCKVRENDEVLLQA